MISITITGADGAAKTLRETPKLIRQAVRSTTLRTARKVEQAIEAGLASEAGSPKRPFSVYRVKARRDRDGSLVWLGYSPIKARFIAGRGGLKQHDWGAAAGKWLFQGSFLARMRSGHEGIFKRLSRSRLPIEEQKIYLPRAPALARQAIAETGSLFKAVLAREIGKRIARDAGGTLQ